MASVGFRWLDILEKEFDKAFVDLDLAVGVLDLEEPDVVYNVRQKLCTLSSCFAQLTHKAQTIFQNSAKIEAELIHMRAELAESKSRREVLEQELHNLLLQLHSAQLAQLPLLNAHAKQDPKFEPQVTSIKKKFEDELKRGSPTPNRSTNDIKFEPAVVESAQLRAENGQLRSENGALRNTILALNSEVYGAKLAAKYLDKELAGRIQQLQLLGREMRGEVRDKLWRQLESEILLQRHKTVVRACRRNSMMSTDAECKKPETPNINELQSFGDVRNVTVKRKPGQGLGISITGGREHGVPILISELETNGPAAISNQLYIGDAILFVNNVDLRQACHKEAVEVLQQQDGDCRLQVQYIAADDSDNSLEDEGYNFRYRFFDGEVCDSNDSVHLHALNNAALVNTPTAPRTPESETRSNASVTHSRSGSLVFNAADNNNKMPLTDTIVTVNNFSQKNIEYEINSHINAAYKTQTTDVILIDNRTENVIKLENFKKTNDLANIEDTLNCSSVSLNSENLSSPMQTSTDIFLDSEILSTDVASNDSHSPKLSQNPPQLAAFRFESPEIPHKYNKSVNANVDTPKSDQSLLNSGESCESSPAHKLNRDYKKPPKKHKTKRYFGVKTLQSIFSKHDGYSDVSSTASDFGDEVRPKTPEKVAEAEPACVAKKNTVLMQITPQFEENIHTFLSEIVKNFQPPETSPSISLSNSTGTKKYFSLHGQNLRVGKALRLCPNEDIPERNELEQRKEKLLARYVYTGKSCSVDGEGDPDFGTPV